MNVEIRDTDQSFNKDSQFDGGSFFGEQTIDYQSGKDYSNVYG